MEAMEGGQPYALDRLLDVLSCIDKRLLVDGLKVLATVARQPTTAELDELWHAEALSDARRRGKGEIDRTAPCWCNDEDSPTTTAGYAAERAAAMFYDYLQRRKPRGGDKRKLWPVNEFGDVRGNPTWQQQREVLFKYFNDGTHDLHSRWIFRWEDTYDRIDSGDAHTVGMYLLHAAMFNDALLTVKQIDGVD